MTKIVTLPIDVVNIGVDHLQGGDGSKRSRTDIPILGDIEEVRDSVCKTMEEMDK